MASFTKTKTGWRAQITLKGVRDSSTHSTKGQAAAWAAERESQIRQESATGIIIGRTFADACRRYEIEVSRTKKGHRWEAFRLTAMSNSKIKNEQTGDKLMGQIELINLSTEIIGRWRDARLETVSGATVNRELNLLSHVLSTARKEWKWLEGSPTTDVRRPKNSAPRDRRITELEIEKICLVLGFDDEPIRTKNQAVAVAFLFAIETAMRAGEICGLQSGSINNRVAHLPFTKNGTKRDVPLSKRAIELLSYLPKTTHATAPIFNLGAESLSTLFRKARQNCNIGDLTFHDSRHEAITRLAKKINVLDLARMVGHRDLRQLQVYYNESAADIAQRLD